MRLKNWFLNYVKKELSNNNSEKIITKQMRGCFRVHTPKTVH